MADRSLVDFLPSVSGPTASRATPEHTWRQVKAGLVVLNLLALALCIEVLFAARQADLANAQAETVNEVRLTAQIASGVFDKASMALNAVAIQVERQLSGGGLNASTLWPIVDSQTAQVAEIERLGVFDARGAQLCGLPVERCLHLNIADREYFQRLRDHPEDPIQLYGPYKSRATGEQTLVLARALHLDHGGFGGVAVASLPLSRLRELVTLPDTRPGGVVSLRTADLVPLLRQPELTGPNASEAGRRVSDTLRHALAASPASGAFRSTAPADGIDRVTAYRKLEGYPLYVFVGRSTDEFLGDWRIQAATTAGFLLLFAAASTLLARSTSTSLRAQAKALRLYDEAPCGYHTLDAQGTYININSTELSWLGCSRAEVVGKLKPTDFFTDEGRAAFAKNFPAVMRHEPVEGVEFDLVGRKGTVRRVLVNATPVFDSSGSFLFANTVVHDISALHKTRSQLRAMAEQQSIMLDNDLIGIVRLRDRRIVWKNRAMDRIFGYSGAEWHAMASRALYFDDATHQRTGTEQRAAFEQGQSYRTQLQMRHKDGHAVWIDATGTLLPASSGEVLMLLADISPLKAAEEERLRAAALAAQNEQLRETNRFKTELVSNLSHELRTPLNGILAYGHMLESGTVRPDSPKYPTYVSRIVSSGKHLLGLIDQVIEYAKAEAGKLRIEPDLVIVADALAEAVTMLRTQSEARQISILVDTKNGPGSVVADPLRLRQMLVALLDNAIKFSHEGGRVELSADVLDEAFWQVSVTDHGIGIEKASIARLFSPFVQLSAGFSRTHGGTGIGLALIKLIALSQGGRIDVRSEVGQGSTFTVTLPLVVLSPPTKSM